nr:MBL fold metallo-hydrolase [Nitrososphaeria archaeon]NIN53771.1 MBL fold metallo-hydrolase [Nitrososphaeria archaeon]NIQ34328.1 MBL fold metallo-hydrolase [Nitrososphaeria archaeon]
MEIIFLGTSAGVPTKERNVTSVAVKRGGELLLFDVGESTQRQLLKAGVGLRVKTKIFVTHLHGDHVVGLLALLQTYSLMRRTEPLEIWGPSGIEEFVKRNMEMLRVSTRFPLHISILQNGVVLEEKEYVVRALRTIHSIETYALSLEEKPRPGRFNPEKARELGIPVKYWRD